MGRLSLCPLGLLCLLSVLPASDGAIIKGFVEKSAGFEFVGKFCFDFTPQNIPHAGFLEAHVTTPEGEDPIKNGLNGLSVLFFDDETTSWDTILNTNKACKDKLGLAKGHFDVNLKGEKMYHGSSWIAQHIRPRFWYVVLANCNGFSNVEYAVHFVNINHGVTNREFGTNDQGLNWIYLFYSCVFTFFVLKHLSGLSGHVDHSPSNSGDQRPKKKSILDDNGDVNDEEMEDGETDSLLSGGPKRPGVINAQKLCCTCLNTGLHPIFKLFTAALVWTFVGVVCMAVHTWSFAFGGVGYPSLMLASQGANVLSRMCFLCLLMLLAKGWTISSNRLTGANTILTTIGCFGAVNFLIVVWESSLDLRSPNSEVPFILRMLLFAASAAWLGFGFWFANNIRQSYAEEYKPAKQNLYIQLACIYLPWIISRPVILVLVELLNPWVRSKIVTSLSLTFCFVGYSVMAYLLWPTRADEYFDVTVPDVSKSNIDNYDEL